MATNTTIKDLDNQCIKIVIGLLTAGITLIITGLKLLILL